MAAFDPNFETRINTALGKILRHFNFFELNLGLCISHLENPKQLDQSYAWLARASIAEKLDRLRTLLQESKIISNHHEFRAWLDKSIDARCLRNFYTHGTWEYLPLRSDAESVQSMFIEFMELRKKYGV
jgi:hypothetical protein